MQVHAIHGEVLIWGGGEEYDKFLPTIFKKTKYLSTFTMFCPQQKILHEAKTLGSTLSAAIIVKGVNVQI